MCSDEGDLGFGSPRRGPLVVESLFDPSFQKFFSFNKFVGLPVDDHEKEIVSLLRKMETRKGPKVSTAKRRPSSMPPLC